MNAVVPANMSNLWFITGWTMIHFLWLGAIVAAAALASRVLLRRASANVRYTIALASLFLLGALPPATALWLTKYSPSLTTSAGTATTATPDLAESSPALAPTIPLPVAPPATALAAPSHGSAAAASAGGLVASYSENNVPMVAAASESPRPSRGLPESAADATPAKFSNELSTFIPYLPWIWLIGTPLTFMMLVSGVVGTRRLSRASRTINDDP
ncbi:MAG TPA: hypothetical protein VH107_14870, partial [Lacipirellulaceae bacterium]|nr:hypothetical protein [Lacipirellulaceae bacterium]